MKHAQTNNDVRISGVVKDTLYLAACAMRQEEPDAARVGRMELPEVYRMSRFHSIEAMTYMALEQMAHCPFADSETGREWKKAKERAIRKTMLLDAERGQILAELERLGIWYMPLKGSVLKDYYPRYGMRQMGDNDILYDTERQEDVVTLMKGRGYTVKCIDKDNQDDFLKLPVYNFEMHSVLCSKRANAAWHAYYREIKDRLLPDGQSQYGYRFTDEDFYIYMAAHAYKHYSVEGTGLRALTDTYAFLSAKEGTLDWRYVRREAEKLGVEAFEQSLRELSHKLFGAEDVFADGLLTPEEEAMLADLAGAGTYGTEEKYVERKMQEYQIGEGRAGFWGKLRYLCRRLFPDMAWFEKHEPFFYRHKILIPFFLAYRAFRQILFHRDWLKRELHILWGGRKKKRR